MSASDPFDRLLHLGRIESDGEKIAEWPHITPAPGVRLHWATRPGEREGGGFRFCCIDEQGSDEDGDLYEIVFYGVAYFDGVRHLHFVGCYDDGYFNYPRLDKMTATLASLRLLEKQQCPYLGETP